MPSSQKRTLAISRRFSRCRHVIIKSSLQVGPSLSTCSCRKCYPPSSCYSSVLDILISSDQSVQLCSVFVWRSLPPGGSFVCLLFPIPPHRVLTPFFTFSAISSHSSCFVSPRAMRYVLLRNYSSVSSKHIIIYSFCCRGYNLHHRITQLTRLYRQQMKVYDRVTFTN